jgi:prevent-host-death family protein
MATYNIYEAKTSFSRLVQEAATGEEVVIAKAGEPLVKMVPVEKQEPKARRKFGQNVMGITYIAPDFYDDLPLDMWECMRDDPEDVEAPGQPTE